MEPTVVGTITIGEGRVHTLTYETAAWHSEVALTPGTYDVTATNPHSYIQFSAHVPGVYVSCHLPALLCGVAVGSQPQGVNHHDVGRSQTVVLRPTLADVTLNPVGYELLGRFWIVSPHHLEFNGYGLVVARQEQLIAVNEVWGMRFRIDPNNGGLSEFTDEVALLADRINELQLAGADPDVWRVTYGDDRKPWFESPFEDHRPYGARKFGRSGGSRSNWRYYRPDYKPGRSY